MFWDTVLGTVVGMSLWLGLVYLVARLTETHLWDK